MIVVADTSPLNCLIQIRLISLLEKLYGHVYLPHAVAEETKHDRAPSAVRQWIIQLPAWVTVARPKKTTDPQLLNLDSGEREAIVLVSELKAELLLVDDQPARVEALRRGIRILGTLGILRDAANKGHVRFEESLSELLGLGFRVTDDVLAQTRAGLT